MKDNTINITMKMPGDAEKNVKFKFNVPNNFQSTKSHDDLRQIITDKLKTMSQTISFLDELVHKDTEQISLSEMITDAIGKSTF